MMATLLPWQAAGQALSIPLAIAGKAKDHSQTRVRRNRFTGFRCMLIGLEESIYGLDAHRYYLEDKINLPTRRNPPNEACGQCVEFPSPIYAFDNQIQFSIFNPSTLLKCFVLLVTKMASRLHACAAMSVSLVPIGVPRFSNPVCKSANCSAARASQA